MVWTGCLSLYRCVLLLVGRCVVKKRKAGGEGGRFSPDLKGRGRVHKALLTQPEIFTSTHEQTHPLIRCPEIVLLYPF